MEMNKSDKVIYAKSPLKIPFQSQTVKTKSIIYPSSAKAPAQIQLRLTLALLLISLTAQPTQPAPRPVQVYFQLQLSLTKKLSIVGSVSVS